jgi:hypothetical protein
MTVSAAELLAGITSRGTCRGAAPVSQRGRSLVSEFMLQQTLVACSHLARLGGAFAHTIGHGRHERGRRAAGLGRAGLTLECSVAIHRLALLQPFQRRAHRRRPQLLQILDRSGALTVDRQTSN